MIYPSQLDWLIEMDKRVELSEKSMKELYRLKSGAEGEQFVLEVLEEFGQPNWTVLKNVWFEYNGYFECDIVVLTKAGIYTFEVKNYTGHFVFENMQCSINGERIGFNPINQTQYSYTNLEKLIHSEMPDVKVYGSLVFVGEYNTLKVHDAINGIQIVMRNELRNHIWEMRKQERDHYGAIVDMDYSIKLFKRYAAKSKFVPEPITEKMQLQLRKGICCSNCGSFNVEVSRIYIMCTCGMKEPLENAIIRTICEYGVIHFDKELVTSNLCTFFGEQVSRNTILRYLQKHFTKIGSNRNTTYHNYCAPFKLIYKEFNLPLKRMLSIGDY